MTNTMTIREAQAIAKENGYTLRKDGDEYRMNIRDGDEATAYYTNDLDEAISTMLWEIDNPVRIDDCPMCGDSPGSYAYCLEHGELG